MRRSAATRGSGTRYVLALLTVVALVAGGGVILGYQMYRDHPAARLSPVTQHGGVARSSAPARAPAPAEPGNSTVAVAPSLAGLPQARPVASFLTSYFRAVNAHDYVAYRRLFDPGMQAVITAASFGAGFRTTVDSEPRLVRITPTAGGGAAANVLFTSHQAPSEGPGRTACTNWSITLFLEPAGNSYLISQPPPGYRPLYQAC